MMGGIDVSWRYLKFKCRGHFFVLSSKYDPLVCDIVGFENVLCKCFFSVLVGNNKNRILSKKNKIKRILELNSNAIYHLS